jgi:hypothetical protein
VVLAPRRQLKRRASVKELLHGKLRLRAVRLFNTRGSHLGPRSSYGASAMCCSGVPCRRGSVSGRGLALFLILDRRRYRPQWQFLLACPTEFQKATVAFTFSVPSRKGERPCQMAANLRRTRMTGRTREKVRTRSSRVASKRPAERGTLRQRFGHEPPVP